MTNGTVWGGKAMPSREEVSSVILSFLEPPTYRGGSWTINPDDAADAILKLFTE